MSENTHANEWYLARDGQQHGPVSDAELQKIIELGYLKPTDLVWRQGWPDWKPATAVLPAPNAPKPNVPAPPPPADPRHAERPAPQAPRGPAPDRNASQARPDAARHSQADTPASAQPAPAPHVRLDAPEPASARQPGRPEADPNFGRAAPAGPRPQYAPATDTPGPGAAPRWQAQSEPGAPQPRMPAPAPHMPSAAGRPDGASSLPPPDYDVSADLDEERGGFPWRTAIVLVILAAMGSGAYAMYRSGKLANLPFLGAPGESAVPVVAAPRSPPVVKSTAPTSVTSAPAPAGVSTVEAHLQNSPLWALLRREFPDWYSGKLDTVRTQTVEGKEPREISANMLREVVNLRRQQSAPALAASPQRLRAIASAFVDNLNRLKQHSTAACYGFISQGETSPNVINVPSKEIQAGIDVQLRSIFEAVAEGRKSPTKHASPKREDYDVLTAELAKRGWNTADLQMFANAKALERAPPEKVCQMVNDWFSAQLAVKDAETQTRLLSEALKPIVAG